MGKATAERLVPTYEEGNKQFKYSAFTSIPHHTNTNSSSLKKYTLSYINHGDSKKKKLCNGMGTLAQDVLLPFKLDLDQNRECKARSTAFTQCLITI